MNRLRDTPTSTGCPSATSAGSSPSTASECIGALGEADAGIEHYPRRRDPGRLGGGQALPELAAHHAPDVGLVIGVRVRGHVAHAAARVHEDHAAPRAAHIARHRRIEPKPRDVVHHVRAVVERRRAPPPPSPCPPTARCPAAHAGCRAITGSTRCQLLRRIDRLRALRARGLAPDVDHVGALAHEAFRVRHGALRREMEAAVAEAVGGDVHDADHDRTGRERPVGRAAARRTERA